MVTICSNVRRLVPNVLESQLIGTGIYTKTGWSDRVKKAGWFIDLSRIEWVDVGALGTVVVLIENALRSNVAVNIALPLDRARDTELKWLESASSDDQVESTRQQISRRIAVRQFLEYLQLSRALRPEHLGTLNNNLTVLTDYDSSSEQRQHLGKPETKTDPEQMGNASGRRYKYHLPLTWVTAENQDKFLSIGRFLARVAGEPQRGMEEIDATTIANVVLFELVQNVLKHSGDNPAALVAAWARPRTLPPIEGDYLECEKEYIRWFRAINQSMVEIIVADSGRGIPDTLRESYKSWRSGVEVNSSVPTEPRPADVLSWSFDRWSTSRTDIGIRGTRGLYRVNRIAMKYYGAITARSSNALAGWDHGGGAHLRLRTNKRLSYVPGTVLRLRIPPYHEIERSRFDEKRTTLPQSIQYEFIVLGPITGDGIEHSDLRKLQELIKSAELEEARKSSCLVVNFSGGLSHKEAIEATLRQAVELRHPNPLVVTGLPGSWDLIETSIHALNAEHEKRKKYSEKVGVEHYDIWNPTLVLGPSLQCGWAGVTESYRELLDFLLAHSKIRWGNLNTVIREPKNRAQSMRSIRSDPYLLVVEPAKEIRLRLSISQLLAAVQDRLKIMLDTKSALAITGPVITPSLVVASKWVKLESLVSQTVGRGLCMLALARRITAEVPRIRDCPGFQILASARDEIFAVHLRTALRASKLSTVSGERGIGLRPDVRIVDRDAYVVLFVGLIASGESLSRIIAQVLRDDAEPIAIACILDARREKTKTIEIWGVEVPVVSLRGANLLMPDQTIFEGFPKINPISEEIEVYDAASSGEGAFEYSTNDQLPDLMGVVHLSHVGRPAGRHFTFFVDITSLLSAPPVISGMNEEISRWIGHNETYRPQNQTGDEWLEIWFPSSGDTGQRSLAGELAQNLVESRSDVRGSARQIHRDAAHGQWIFAESKREAAQCPNIVIVDWGVLTGRTINEGLRRAAEAGAQKVLVLVLLSQLPVEQHTFYLSLRFLEVKTRNSVQAGQLDLPIAEEFLKEPRHNRLVGVKFSFRHVLDVNPFQPSDCPVCQQLARLSWEEFPTDFLRTFAEEQYARLRLRSREEVLGHEGLDIDQRELPSAAASWMIDFRRLLQQALSNTTARIGVVERLQEIARQTRSPGRVPAEALWLMTFLSVEGQWFRKAPISLRRLREKLASLAITVANHQELSTRDRMNALIVCRTASKRRFSENLAALVMAAGHNEDVLGQILYNCFTFINRPYLYRKPALAPLKSSLVEARDHFESHAPGTSIAIKNTFDALLEILESEMARSEVRGWSRVRAWMTLRHKLGESYRLHDNAAEAFRLMLPGPDAPKFESIISERPARLPGFFKKWLEGLALAWRPAEDFFAYTIHPCLARMRPIIASEDGERAFGLDYHHKLLALIDLRRPKADYSFSHWLSVFRESPESVLDIGVWQNFTEERDFLYECIFRPRSTETAPSRLISYLEQAPVSIEKAVNTALEEIAPSLQRAHIIEKVYPEKDVEVFCTSGLLLHAVQVVLENAVNHRAQRDMPVEIAIAVEVVKGRISLRIRNSNSVSRERTDRRSVGLQRLRERLEAFDGELHVDPRPQNDWATFIVTINLLDVGGYDAEE